VLGSDARGDAVAFATDNARAAGIGHLLRFEKRDVRDFRPPDGPPGVILCNPPYGERLGEEKDLYGLYRLLGEVFAERCRDWSAFVFTGNPRLARAIGLKPAEEVPLFNGKIACRLLRFEAV
jgi:putative N6-adenine-specific DNA methylase